MLVKIDFRAASMPLTTAAARTSAAAAAAFARLVAVPAKHRAITARLKRHCCRLTASRTNHRCSLCRSRTVAGSPLIVLLCLTACLTTLWGRVTAFLEERLISGGKAEVLPAIAARKLYISGHGSPRGNCTADCTFSVQGFHKIEKSCFWRKADWLPSLKELSPRASKNSRIARPAVRGGDAVRPVPAERGAIVLFRRARHGDGAQGSCFRLLRGLK